MQGSFPQVRPGSTSSLWDVVSLVRGLPLTLLPLAQSLQVGQGWCYRLWGGQEVVSGWAECSRCFSDRFLLLLFLCSLCQPSALLASSFSSFSLQLLQD